MRRNPFPRRSGRPCRSSGGILSLPWLGTLLEARAKTVLYPLPRSVPTHGRKTQQEVFEHKVGARASNLGALANGLGCFPFDAGAFPPTSHCRLL